MLTINNTFSRAKWLILHLPPTFAIIIHIPRPLRPCIWRPCVPIPHVPASHTWCPQVPRLASPSPMSPHTRPEVPVPLTPCHFYTQPHFCIGMVKIKIKENNNVEKSPKSLFKMLPIKQILCKRGFISIMVTPITICRLLHYANKCCRCQL